MLEPKKIDAATTSHELATMAAENPDLWPAILQHPNCYPDLRAWITERQRTEGDTPSVAAPQKGKSNVKIIVAGIVGVALLTTVAVGVITLTSKTAFLGGNAVVNETVIENEPSPSVDTQEEVAGALEMEEGSDEVDLPAAPTPTCSDGSAVRELTFPAGTTWVGDMVEEGGAKYKISAVLEDDGCEITGTFNYHSGLECRGTWTDAQVDESALEATPRKLGVKFVETVQHNPAKDCAPIAEVNLELSLGEVKYKATWLQPNGERWNSSTMLRPDM